MNKNWFLTGNTSIYLLVFRCAVSLLMISHGWPKMVKFFNGGPIEFADPVGFGPGISLALAVFAEVFCSLLIIVGLKTRFAVIPPIITMLVAVFVVHLNDSLADKEAGILFLLSYGVIFIFGPGKYSVDGN